MLESLTTIGTPIEQSEGCTLRFPLRLRRVWQRTANELALQYVDGAGEIVPGQWYSNPDQARTQYRRLNQATGRVALAQAGGDLVVLQPKGAELKLPALEQMLSLPGAELVTHRPGRRAVVRFDDGSGRSYAKALRPSKVGRVIAASRFIEHLEGRAFGVAPLVATDESAGLLVTREIAGRNLHDLARSDPNAFIDGCERAGAALRSLHVPPTARVRVHEARDEAAMLLARAEGIRLLAPELYVGVCAACERAADGLGGVATERVVLHRDFYDKQIVVRLGGCIGLLDFDTLGAGEAALDLSNMLAHLELRVVQGDCSAETAGKAARAFLSAYGPDAETKTRIVAYQDAARARLAMLYALRPKWAHLSPRLLGSVGTEPAWITGGRAEVPVSERPKRTKTPCPLMFVIGCPRSGTTMLERMLNAHRDVAMTHETHWVTRHAKRGRTITREGCVTTGTLDALYADRRFTRMAPPRAHFERIMAHKPLKYRRFVRHVFQHYRESEGKPFVGDKSTGGHVREIDRLRKVCPDSKIVHLVRDGRDVCLSMLVWSKAGRAAGRFAMFNHDPVATTAAWWKWHVHAAMCRGRAMDAGVYREVRYEALVRDPEGECAALCQFLGIGPDPAMSKFHAGRTAPGKSANASWLPPTPGLRDWRTQLASDQIEMFEAIAGDTLSVLGYERWFPRISARVADLAAERLRRWGNELGNTKQTKQRRGIAVATGTSSSKGELR